MIQPLYQLGIALQEVPKYAQYFASYANPFPNRNKKGEDIVWIFSIEEDRVTGLDKEPFSSQKLDKYLFRKPKGARGAPLVATGPTYPVSDPQDSKKRDGHLENVDKLMSRIERSIPTGKSAYFSNDEARTAGLAVVRRVLENEAGTSGNRYLYTFKIDGKWLGDIPELVDLLDDEAYAKYYEKSSAKGKTCALTHEQGVEVWGRVDTLGFTVNDKAFNRGGFDDKASYRMFPVSKKAVLTLEGARRFAFQNLTGGFYPLEFLIIPRMIEGGTQHLLPAIEKMSKLKRADSVEQQRKTLLETDRKVDYIAENADMQRAGMLYDILFFHRNQAQLALDLLLQDVSPTHIVRLKSAQETINRFYGYAFGKGDKAGEREHFQISVITLKQFFLEGSGTKVRLHPFFYSILEGLFLGEPISESAFLAGLLSRLRESFKHRNKHNFFPGEVKKAIAAWQFLARLGLFENVKPSDMDQERNGVAMDYAEFLRQHDNFYGKAPALKGAFLLGVLTGMLTYAQYKAINSKPFLHKTRNLKLGMDELIGLSSELLDKIHQYQDRSKVKGLLPYTEVTQLFAEAYPALAAAGKASRDELSFAFATGLVMQQQFGQEKSAKAKSSAATSVE